MKRRRILLLLALAAVATVAGLVFFSPRGPKEPVIEGKRLGIWLSEAMTQSRPVAQDQAEEAAKRAVKAIGTNAIPWLLSEYARTDPNWRVRLDRWVGRITGSGSQFSADEIRLERAFKGLELLGPDLAPALPELARVLGGHDRERLFTVGFLMAAAGEPAIPFLVQGLASTNLMAEISSANGLGWLAKDTEAAVPPLVRALQSTNMPVRNIAAMRLAYVPFRPELTVPALTAALRDPETNVSHTAAISLTLMRDESAPLVAKLRRLMAETNLAVALTASNALHQLETTNWSPRRP